VHWLRLRDPRMRSVLGLVGVLGLYFFVPVEQQSSILRLVGNVAIALACMVIVATVVLGEFRRMQLGESLKFTGGQLLIVLELLLVAFALTYFSLAVHGQDQMAGIRTRLDALYFSATTITTVGYGDVHPVGQLARGITTAQLVFDVVFIAAFARLLTRATGLPHRHDDDPPPPRA
jgi:voltage-gated potassium channel